MNTPQKPENDIHYADTQHPVDHIEPLPQDGDDSIERICQVLGRTFEWVAEADEPSEKGLRAAVVLYCVRSDLIGRESLEDLAFSLHYTESEVENLVTNFCHAINWRQPDFHESQSTTMLHPAPEQIYPLILEDYFFSLVDRGVPTEETPLFTGNIEGEDLTSAVRRRFGLCG